MYTKEQVIAIELKKAKEIAREYKKAEHAYLMARGLVSDKEANTLLENVFIQTRVLAAHIFNLNDIDDTVKFYNTPNAIVPIKTFKKGVIIMYYQLKTFELLEIDRKCLKLDCMIMCQRLRFRRCLRGYVKKSEEYFYLFKNRFGNGIAVVYNNPNSTSYKYIDYYIFDNQQTIDRILQKFGIACAPYKLKYSDLEVI